MYLCPSRRSPASASRAGFDYVGFRDQNRRAIFSIPVTGYNVISINVSNPGARRRVTLADVSSADGASNSLLLAHKGMDPQSYSQSAQTMGHNPSWAGSRDDGHQAALLGFARDLASPQIDQVDPTPEGDYQVDANNGCSPWSNRDHHNFQKNCSISNRITGSPHPGAMPVLWADGAVRSLRYGVPRGVYESMAFWQDGAPIDPAWRD